MKFYPSTHPSNKDYPSEKRRENENTARRSRIARIRQLAQSEMNPAKARKLNEIADALAQENLPLKEKPVKRQKHLFDPERLD